MEIPKLKGRVLTERITVPVTPDVLKLARTLKETHNVDTASLLRAAIMAELERTLAALEEDKAS